MGSLTGRRVGGGKFIDMGDGTTWIDPLQLDDLNWQLRYAPTEANLLLAADAISCFRALVTATNSRRDEVCNAIKRTPATPEAGERDK